MNVWLVNDAINVMECDKNRIIPTKDSYVSFFMRWSKKQRLCHLLLIKTSEEKIFVMTDNNSLITASDCYLLQ